MITLAEEYRTAIIAMLIRLMAADGQKNEKEFVYILHVAYELGMSADDLQALKPEIFSQELILPAAEKERMTILYYLLLMLNIDGQVHEAEENLIRDFGHQLGFRIELVSDLTRVIKASPTSAAPTDQILNEIRRYLN